MFVVCYFVVVCWLLFRLLGLCRVCYVVCVRCCLRCAAKCRFACSVFDVACCVLVVIAVCCGL